MQLAISDSHSSLPNWHLTAAPHGLLAGSPFYLAWEATAVPHQTSLRGQLLPGPSAPLTTPLHLRPASIPFPSNYLVEGRSLHPRHPQVLIISVPSRPVALKSTPLPLSNNSSPTSMFSPLPHGGATWGRCQDIEDVLPLSFEPKEATHMPGIWPHFQNLIFL